MVYDLVYDLKINTNPEIPFPGNLENSHLMIVCVCKGVNAQP